MRAKNHRTSWPIKIAVVLLYLVIVTLNMVSGLYARYTSSDSGEDASRVAAFYVDLDNPLYTEDLVLSMSPGVTLRHFSVKNDSEVTVEAKWTVENKTLNLPLRFIVYPNENKPEGDAGVEGILNHSEYLQPGEECNYTMEIIWESDTALEDMGKVDLIKMTVLIQQVD